MNYRIICTSILDGSLYDVAEYRDWADVLSHADRITRWDIHCYVVCLYESRPFAMSNLIPIRGAK